MQGIITTAHASGATARSMAASVDTMVLLGNVSLVKQVSISLQMHTTNSTAMIVQRGGTKIKERRVAASLAAQESTQRITCPRPVQVAPQGTIKALSANVPATRAKLESIKT